jgi:hypothetical protein
MSAWGREKSQLQRFGQIEELPLTVKIVTGVNTNQTWTNIFTTTKLNRAPLTDAFTTESVISKQSQSTLVSLCLVDPTCDNLIASNRRLIKCQG